MHIGKFKSWAGIKKCQISNIVLSVKTTNIEELSNVDCANDKNGPSLVVKRYVTYQVIPMSFTSRKKRHGSDFPGGRQL